MMHSSEYFELKDWVMSLLTKSFKHKVGIPDYSNQTAIINSQNNYEATIPDDGTINVQFSNGSTTNTNSLRFYINNALVVQCVGTRQYMMEHEYFPVSKGDVVKFVNDSGVAFSSFIVYFIPNK